MSDVSRQDNFKARRHLPRSGVSTLERDFGYLKENIPCQDACPANTNIPIYIKQAHDGDYAGCYETNRKVNILPGVLGRICSRPCEDKCRHGEHDLGDPVAICHIKRSGADLRDSQNVKRAPAAASTGKHIAVVGAGPSGLAAAHDLAMNGHKVTLYEARELTGGMLYYGIPRFRLPTEVISGEVDDILALGIECRANTALGSDVTASALLDEHNAVLVAAGCYSPRSLGIGGEDLDGVVSGLEFMMGVNSGSPREGMRSVVVIGGGFTAMDCARTARRLGAEVKVAVLTTEDEMFATRDEITEAKREGIEILTMAMSREFIAGDDGKLGRARFVRTKLGELTPDGLMHEALPIEGSEFELDVDTVIVAIGQGPDPSILDVEVTRDEKGRMVVDRDEFTCGVEGLYLTGDFAWGASTVIESIANGRRAAAHITQMLTGVRPLKWAVTFEAAKPSYRERSFDFIARTEMPSPGPIRWRRRCSAVAAEMWSWR